MPGPRQTVQRAEICGVLLSLQGNVSTHVGVDNLNVLRHVSRWCMASCLPAFPHVKSGDVLGLVQRMIHSSSVGASQVSKVEGHADEDMVLRRQVREIDCRGNDADGANETAEFGRALFCCRCSA